MPVPVVYENVESQGDDAGEIEGLFNGLKFWLVRRMPSRAHYLSTIQQNGGSIVQQDKDADIIIADHATKRAPNGSYSWKLIEDSLKSGELADKAEYLINRPVPGKAPGPSATAGQTRGTRTPFTAEDDAFLIKWVLSNEYRYSRNGKVMYQGLAEQNKRHTLQSWRDRWRKKFDSWSIEALLSQAQLQSVPGAATDGPEGPASPSLRPPSVSRSPDPRRETPQSRRRRKFTQEDDDMLIEAIRTAEQQGQTPSSGWFREFAENNPSHSSQSWFDHWRQVIKPRLQQDIPEPSTSSAGPPSPELSATRGVLPPRTTRPRTPRHNAPSSSLPDLRETAEPRGASPGHTDEAASERTTDNEGEREQFYAMFRAFLQLLGRPATDMNPGERINGREIDLYQLYKAVMESRANDLNTENGWQLVAISLGFNPQEVPSAPAKLKKYWIFYLQDFAPTIQDVSEGGGETNSEDQQDEDDTDVQTPRNQALSSRGAWLPSSQTSRAQKRRHNDYTDAEHPAQEHTGRKRQRRSRNDEIPSTPDDRLGIRKPNSSPGGQFTSPTPDVSRPPLGSAARGNKSSRARYAEPETQDFNIGIEEENDITPSQQLHAEEKVMTPVPLHLPSKEDANSRPTRTSSQRASGIAKPSDRTPSAQDDIVQWSKDVAANTNEGEDLHGEAEDGGELAELASQIERFESVGYSGEDVRTAIRATSCDIGLAGHALEYMRRGQGLPLNMEGVWTDRDDNGLLYVDGKPSTLDTRYGNESHHVRDRKRNSELKRLLHKHTQERIEARREYLEFAAQCT